jgi:DHA2 family multidrug resistance protein
MVLYPPMLQELRGYPDSIIGLLLAARGIGALVGNFATIWISRRDPRIGLGLGFASQIASCWMLAQFNINMTTESVAWASVLQGLGVGLAWVPLTMVMFSNTAKEDIPEGTAVLHLLRNIGSSIYISIAVGLVVRSTTVNYAQMTERVSPYNKLLDLPSVAGLWSARSTQGLTQLSDEISRQAAMLGYLDAFHLLAVTGLVAMPFILLVQPARPERDDR